jgi:hypothetical protein
MLETYHDNTENVLEITQIKKLKFLKFIYYISVPESTTGPKVSPWSPVQTRPGVAHSCNSVVRVGVL